MNERYAAGILRYRWLVIVATILLVALAASGERRAFSCILKRLPGLFQQGEPAADSLRGTPEYLHQE